VTFLFTDIEGSTRSWEDQPGAMRLAVERHDAIICRSIADHGGYVFSTGGDAFAAAFGRAGDAVASAREAQAALAGEPWPEPVSLRVRMGVHTGEAQERDGDYFGPALNRASRIMGAANGGQVLVSASTAELLEGEVLVDLGEHRLKDLSQPLRLFQLGDGAFEPIATLAAGSGALPVQRTELLGRADEVRAVVELVSTHRLVTLMGFGGIGKTRLALAAAAEVAGRFRRGAYFVDLAPIDDGTLVGLTALEAVGIAAAGLGGAGSVHERAAAALAGQDLLLVLDNCEHVVEDVVEFVDRLLELSDVPVVLATSREALEIDGERRYRVRPLEVVDGESSSPAVELFVQRAVGVGGRAKAVDPKVGEICRRLDGVPLAIELAAARTSVMSVHELAARLEQQLDVLALRRRRGRHRSLEAVLEWSWNLLDDDVADLLVQLAVFTGGWTLEAAEAICDANAAVVERLQALVACSLVEVTESPTVTRFWMLEPVRQFAAARLESDPRHELLRDRHLDWWVQHATGRPVGEQWFSGWWAAELRDEFDNFRSAVTRALNTGRPEDAAALLGAIHAFSMDGFRAAELDLLADAVLTSWRDPPAQFWLARAINAVFTGDHRRLAHCLDAALERAVEQDDLACEAWAADWVSLSLANVDPDRAKELADRALVAARLVGDRDLLVITLAFTGRVAHITGDDATALGRLEEATGLEELTRAAPAHGVHARQFSLYRAYPRAHAGDVAAVAHTMDEAFDLSLATGNPNAYTDIVLAAAELLERSGSTDEAAAIVAALYRQTFTSTDIYYRYRQARSRLPSAPTPDVRLTVPELRILVDAEFATLTGQSATSDMDAHP
jgi:predicted ATPase